MTTISFITIEGPIGVGKTALECEEKATIYAQRKVEVEKCVRSHQGQSDVPQVFLPRLDKVSSLGLWH
ncbi:hypothetical protein JNUCC74_17325 [Cerasibacillus sp. JNUCC 74]